MSRFCMVVAAGVTLVAPASLAAQSLAARISSAPAAVVRFSFDAKPGVCGDGEYIMIVDSTTGARDVRMVRGSYRRGDDRFDEQGRLRDCEVGPVVIALTRLDGTVTDARVRVGGSSDEGTDLGHVAPTEAVAYLLAPETVTRAETEAAGNLVFAATLAAAESWPALLRLARTRELHQDARARAVFWLSLAAGDRAAAGLRSIIGDDSDELEVRKQAVFALSRIAGEQTVTQLMEIARTHREPEIRKVAMFWLGRSKDPRVVDFFEQVLLGRRD